MTRLIVGFLLITSLTDLALAQQVESSWASSNLQSRVKQDLLGRPLGNHTLQVLNLPDEYLRRVADRAIRASFESQLRIVVRETKPGITPPEDVSNASDRADTNTSGSDLRARSLMPIWIGIALIVITGLILARRGKSA